MDAIRHNCQPNIPESFITQEMTQSYSNQPSHQAKSEVKSEQVVYFLRHQQS